MTVSTNPIADPGCTRCKLHETTDRVCVLPPHKKCEIMVVGEAPGRNEERTGKLFSGPAGQLLEEVLNEHGIKREDVYITNAVSCRPPGNRTPKKGEIKACRYWLQRQFTRVGPKFVLLLGNVPLESTLGLKGIKKLRGKAIERDGIIYLPTYHPAYILRDKTQESTFSADIRFFAEITSRGEIPREEGLNWRTVKDNKEYNEMLDELWGTVSYDIETSGLYPWHKDARLNSLGFGTRNTQWTMPAQFPDSPWAESRIIELLNIVKERVDSGKLKLVMQNGKFDCLYTWVIYGIRLTIDFDTMLAHYLVDENDFHGLKHLSRVYFGAVDYDVDEETKTGKKGYDAMAYYQAHDLYYTRRLKFRLKKQLEEDSGVLQVFERILMPCANLFTEIEYNGVYLNLNKMHEAEVYLRELKANAEKELNSNVPKGVTIENWGSPKQLAKLLFEDLNIEIVERTKKGAPSTSESVLKRIDHPMVGALLRFREAKQQLSFFIDGWKPFLDGKRLHPNFRLHGTVTGRLSCEHPNLQQVPRDTRIRSLITAPPGWVLLEADLSQIELRIAAELSGDDEMMRCFKTGVDIHWLTMIREIERGGGEAERIIETASAHSGRKIKNYGDACKVVLEMGFESAEAIDKTWKELRKKAKAVAFGYLYGMWWKKFKIYARDNYGVTVTDEQAQASRKLYFELYKALPQWHNQQRSFARRHGYVRSLSGRKRRLPAATHPDDTPERGAAERQAINSPVQSFASDLNLMAMIQLREEFSPKVLRFVATVHDAILMEVRKDYAEQVYNRVLQVMSRPKLVDEFGIDMEVPIEAEAKLGPWGSGVNLKKWLETYNE